MTAWRGVDDQDARAAVLVAQRHGTTIAAEWLGISTFTMRSIRHELDPDYQRGRGHPTKAEIEAAKPNQFCPCQRCRGHYRTLRIKTRHELERRYTPQPGPISDDPDWIDQGNCRGMHPSIWFPERGASVTRQKAICATCDVRQQCLDYALEHSIKSGIWGGTSERERRRIRSARNAEKRAAS